MRFCESNPYNLATACLCAFVDWWRVSLWLICFVVVLVVLTAVFLISDRLTIDIRELLVYLVFYPILVPLLSQVAEQEKEEKAARRRWTDFAWLILSVLLFLFYLLRAVGIIPGPRPELLEYGASLLLLYVGFRRVIRPGMRRLRFERALVFVAAGALVALVGLSVTGTYTV